MGHRIIDQQEMKLRLTLPTTDGRVVAIYDDPELIEHDDYAPGVMHELQRAWLARDYFYAELREGERVVDQIGSMAGYGGPRKAAEAAASEHFMVELQGVGSPKRMSAGRSDAGRGERRRRAPQPARRGRASKKRPAPKRRAAAKRGKAKRRRG